MFVFLQATADEYSYWNLVVNAPPLVKALVAVLVVMAFLSWFIMGAKAVRLFQAALQTRTFLLLFWREEETGTRPLLAGLDAKSREARLSTLLEERRAL